MNQTLARKVQEDSTKLLHFSKLLTKAIQDKFIKQDLTDDEFAHMINLITCIQHRSKEINFEINSYVTDFERKMKVYVPKIDKKV